MALACHGNGNISQQGCCYVDGVICPNRVTSVNLTAFINSLGLTGNQKTQAQTYGTKALQSVTWACGVAIKVAIANPSLLNDRTAFDAAWVSHPDYLVTPAPSWRALEAAQGRPVNSYNCSSWGPTEAQCCFGEVQSVNDAKMALLDSTQVTIRKARKG